jgi:hypothetical protein
MKRKICLIVFLFVYFCKYSDAQILCIYCYDQNDSISDNVNNLLLNGGFENTNCIPYPGNGRFCPNSVAYNCDIVNWICTGGGVSTYANICDTTYSVIVEGIRAAYFGNDFCNSCSSVANDTSCISNTDCTVSGIPIGYPVNTNPGYGGAIGVSLQQTVAGLIVGNTYVLEFWVGGEQGYINEGFFAVDIGFGNTLLRDKSTQHPFDIGTRYIIEFIASSPTHTIKFTNWGHICSSCPELVLDDARLYTLAELPKGIPHCSTGINALDKMTTINIYFSLSGNELRVNLKSNDNSEITLYDIASKKLLQRTFINSVVINTEQLANGLYIYEVRNRNGVIKKGKVVKE